jgi:hypothetical protein
LTGKKLQRIFQIVEDMGFLKVPKSLEDTDFLI